MVVPIPHRRSFVGKLRTSILKRRLRLLRWLGRQLGRPDDVAFTCHYFGAKFSVRRGDLISEEIAINRFEWRDIALMLAACKEYSPKVFIDVGANIGLYSCILGKAKVVPEVVAFEPDRKNFAYLLDNIECNGLSNIVRLYPCAVGAKRSAASLVAGPADNSGLSRVDLAGAGEYDVEVVALDDELDIRDSTITIKIDVEGHELEVLAGAVRLFSCNSGYAEIEGQGDDRAAEITDLMGSYGWHFVDRYRLNLGFERRV